jgi:HEPN domain-containing protein
MNIQEEIVCRLQILIQKADQVIATNKPNPPGVIGFPTLSSELFSEWQAQSISYLINLLGEHHTYVEKFKEKVKREYQGNVKAGKGILKAVLEDIQGGYLRKIETLVSADIFTDFIEMAEHLINQGYKDVSASLAGAVLEDGLRKICANNGIKFKSTEDISSLNQKLADASVYNRLTQKKVQVWNDIRNNADHGHFEGYTKDDVEEMIKAIKDFLEKYYS